MKILAVLPVSRLDYLQYVIDSLVNQSYKEQPALLVMVDGDAELFIKARNLVTTSKLNNVVCYQSEDYYGELTAIPLRRKRIAELHNEIANLVSYEWDYVFSIEDDGILPTNALSWLINDMHNYPNAGLVTGVELGRWGVPYVGAWYANDLEKPTDLSSVPSRVLEGETDTIDACGLYCALIRTELYKTHEFTSENGLGPDINLGLGIRRLGFYNYIDWFVPVTHLTKRGEDIVQIPATNKSVPVHLERLGNTNTWHAGA